MKFTKLFITTLAIAGLTTTAVLASPLDDFRNDGQIGGPLNLDFAMQNEVNSAISAATLQNRKVEKTHRAGIAGAGSMAMLPKIDGAVAGSLATFDGESSVAMGYSKAFGVNEKHFGTIAMSLDTQSNEMFGIGYAYKF